MHFSLYTRVNKATFFVSVDSRSHAKSKMGEGLEGRTKVMSDEKFKSLNKALKVNKKKPQGTRRDVSTFSVFC